MTKKSVQNFVNGMVADVCQAKGLSNTPANKGGARELATGRVYEALHANRDVLLRACGLSDEQIAALKATPAPVADEAPAAAPAAEPVAA